MSRSRKVFYGIIMALLVFAGLEGGLRLAGFRYLRVTTDMEFNYPRPGFIKAFFEIDPELLYRIRPTVKQRYVDLTWQPHFDLKIRDARTFGAKPTGTVRIIALGDSSTYGVNTPRPWPRRLQEILERKDGTGHFQVINLGVPGYTAFQGRRVLQTRGRRFDPDVVVIAFGWNDHLLALGHSDADQKVGGATVVSLRNLLAHSRVYQGLSWLVAGLRSAAATRAEPAGEGARLVEPLRRVGATAYGEELETLVRLTRELGAEPLLCTYPIAFQVLADEGLDPPEWVALTHTGPGDSLGDLIRLHDRYNDVVRATGRKLGVLVVDLDARFATRDRHELFDAPGGDLIHPVDAGYDLMAASIYDALEVVSGR
ncbi:MAG: SGNH/GDSL hydrolase family protein [Acidobacteria bacterium]|nr:SGNH/GDSL hydrolase family protein [Acidobacteriota bacterium]